MKKRDTNSPSIGTCQQLEPNVKKYYKASLYNGLKTCVLVARFFQKRKTLT